MKRKVLAVLAAAGVLGVSGTALAGVNVNIKVDTRPQVVAQAKTQAPQFQKGQRPPMPPEMSRDRRMPPPPKGSPDKRPPEFDGKMPPRSGDRQMPPPPGAHSPDKRPPMSKR